MSIKFSALIVDQVGEDVSVAINELTEQDLPEGDVLIKVKYSSVNYKDGLASIRDGKIVTKYPFVPGIDLAGIVASSTSDKFKEGDKVIVTGYDLGVSHYGGFSEYARVPENWVVSLPDNLTLQEAMAFGTAGFTAALSVHKLEASGVTPDKGKVLVAGATGGVGSVAVAMLAKQGYEVVASTGKISEHNYLKQLGASEIISRTDLQPEKLRLLDRQQWYGAVDPVGGEILSFIISSLQYGGSVATCGNTGGIGVPTSVFPFILRGVNLLGVDSVYCPYELRIKLWQRMANELKPATLMNMIGEEVLLQELPETLAKVVRGESKGRNIVRL